MTYTEAEYDLLYHPRARQSRELRDGFTREQAERMFKRRDADKRAAETLYENSKSVKQTVDDLLAAGAAHVMWLRRWMYLGNGENAIERWPFGSKVAQDYIKTALNLGEFKRNYD